LFSLITASLLIAAPTAAKPTLVVAPLQSAEIDKDDADTLGEMIRIHVGQSDRYTLVTPEDMGAIDEELKRQLSGGCAEASCIAELGGALGAQFMITGKLKRMGKSYILLLKLLDIETVKAINTQKFRGGNPEAIADLIDSKVAELLGEKVAQQQTPRPQGPSIQGGEITAELGWLSVMGKPAGASVTVTGPSGYKRSFRLPKNKPWMGRVSPGSYRWRATLIGYEGEEGSVMVRVDQTSGANFLLKQPGNLIVAGSPKGARVRIEGPNDFVVERGLPVTIKGAPRGLYRILISRQGYRGLEQRVQVQAETTRNVKIQLEQLSEIEQRRLLSQKQAAKKMEWTAKAKKIDSRISFLYLEARANAGVGSAGVEGVQPAYLITLQPAGFPGWHLRPIRLGIGFAPGAGLPTIRGGYELFGFPFDSGAEKHPAFSLSADAYAVGDYGFELGGSSYFWWAEDKEYGQSPKPGLGSMVKLTVFGGASVNRGGYIGIGLGISWPAALFLGAVALLQDR
jgi:hypothetical protein